MTIPVRDITITGVFAESASTSIPDVPVNGTSYRDTAMTAEDINKGWPYKIIVDSAQFNQAMYQYTSICKMQETYGFIPWSDLTDYQTGSFCLGTDGVLYQAKQETGPSSTAYNPVNDTSHTYWKDYIKSLLVLATPVGSIFPYAGTAAPEGFLMCNGDAISRTTYADLFAVIGTAYGAGDGSTTFNLPNGSERSLWGNTRGYVESGLPDHNHTVTYNGAYASGNGWGSGGDAKHSVQTATTSKASASNNIYGRTNYVRPQAIGVNYIIKY